MDNGEKWIVGIDAGVCALLETRLISALAGIFPIEFRPCGNGDYNRLDALIVTTSEHAKLRRFAALGLPIFSVIDPASSRIQAASARFCLEESHSLDASLQGHRFEEHEPVPIAALAAIAGDEVLAVQDGKPVWLKRRVAQVDVTMVAWPLPHFSARDHFYQHFRASRFIQLLPLLQFFRDLTRQADWGSPPTPACLVVDDPSLYSQTYGHVDFGRVAAEAREQGFHVSIATVPLDSWWINRQVGEVFRKNAPNLSVLIHGNNHTRDELAQPTSEAENLALLAQALRRWRRVEHLPGLEVCRVMECPHGALSVAMLEPMARLGYEAAFATTAHLLRCNTAGTFPSGLGSEKTLLGTKALPLISRIPAEAGWQTEVRLAAFLRKPIILATHHWDFAEGICISRDFAGIVNSLPNVRWASPNEIARTAYQFREENETLHLKLGSRLSNIPITPGARQVMIHRPWLRGATESERLTVWAQGNELLRIRSSEEVVGPIALEGGAALGVSCSVLNRVDCDSVPAPRIRYWPFVRKILVEVRDRSCLHLPIQRRDEPANKLAPNGRRAGTSTTVGAK